MNDSPRLSITQVQELGKNLDAKPFSSKSKPQTYKWVNDLLSSCRYFRLSKPERSIVKSYLATVTGYSGSQLTKLISKKKVTGVIRLAPWTARGNSFRSTYTPEDIALLLKLDNAHGRLSGPATKRLLVRAFEVFGEQAFARLKNISISHIYRLREKRQYTSKAAIFRHTQAVQRNIGERRKPRPDGKPGFLRVDSVHQGDQESEKGVYHINLVDEVTQWEIIGCTEKISEYYLLPVLEDCLSQFPFNILNFHSDNGSEYINQVTAELLNNLLIRQTKSRSRHSNDNALIEEKNGWVIRKHMGYSHIAGKFAGAINQFYKTWMNVYLNFHRPCGFATWIPDRRGKLKKKYQSYLTPYEKLTSLENWTQYLKPGVSRETLYAIAHKFSDNLCVEHMQEAKKTLFQSFLKAK